MPSELQSVAVRAELVEALHLDLVGPSNDHAFANELLPEAPSRWYLTGYLVPKDAPEEQRTDETSTEEIDGVDDPAATDDAAPPDRSAARRGLLPSSIGISVLVEPQVEHLAITVRWGDYVFEGGRAEHEEDTTDTPQGDLDGQDVKKLRGYRRIPREERITLTLPKPVAKPNQEPVPNSDGLVVVATSRAVSSQRRLPRGALSVSVFLVNERQPDANHHYRKFAFQAELELQTDIAFVPRPDLRGALHSGVLEEWDEQVADLHYRDVFEHAVGHGVATRAHQDDGSCHLVKTEWLPTAEVERVEPSAIIGVELSMEALANIGDAADAAAKLSPIVEQYQNWIDAQSVKLSNLEPERKETAEELLKNARVAAKRIEAGIAALSDTDVLFAFKVANRAMARAARRREAILRKVSPDTVEQPKWRPFQLAFILMTLRGIALPQHDDRETVDLLFFPTGGGKTEAYLGLAAFTMVLRRLRHPGIGSAGVSVLMRYTLRLLTLDQLGRAAALICALELERQQDRERLGTWPFEIGLWVGSAATPNRMGYRGYTGPGAEQTAYRRANKFKSNSRNPSPIPIENCPWCGEKFGPESFRLTPTLDKPLNLEVRCLSERCEFSGDRSLPILGVDEPIYRRLPVFLIATVDKFAALPFTGETGTLFGNVDRADANGFYGPCTPDKGNLIGGPLPAPDLIIQDELHLISGPLGTIAGVYEIAIDALSARQVGGKTVRPKIVASTATVRRAERQIRSIFGRNAVAVFPPPGPDRTDSFFAHTEPADRMPARLYLGIAAQGRSLKVVMLRAARALLSAAATAYEREGGKRNKSNPADPYMTLVGYFNGLRELGGSRRIIEDEVRTQLAQYSRRKRLEPADNLFRDREISFEPIELTSRVSTSDVAIAKRRLAQPFYDDGVDVALATNMISVGLDILRLGLMVVLGQPKTSAEYIQATSRVGRDLTKPGLVVTLLNIHKPRDRSHYERFETYHATFYRSVEVTSVTPFSPRALDRALVAALVALCRQGNALMTPPLGAGEILVLRSTLEPFVQLIADRARDHDPEMKTEEAERLREGVTARCRRLLDDWQNIADYYRQNNTKLQYQRWEAAGAKKLLYDMLDPELSDLRPEQRKFRAGRSMRDVEATVDLVARNLNDWPNRQ